MGKIVNLEFLIPTCDYFASLALRDWVWDWGLPTLISYLLHRFFLDKITPEQAKELLGIQINCVAVLLGFSMACLTVFASSTNTNIETLKTESSGKRWGNEFSLYQVMLANYTFSLIISIIAMIFTVVVYFLFLSKSPCSQALWVTTGVFLLLYILFLNIRNMTNFYHVNFNNKKK